EPQSQSAEFPEATSRAEASPSPDPSARPHSGDDALRRSDELLRLISENLRESLFVLTREPLAMEYVSSGYDEIWGRPARELYERPTAWLESVHPADRG